MLRGRRARDAKTPVDLLSICLACGGQGLVHATSSSSSCERQTSCLASCSSGAARRRVCGSENVSGCGSQGCTAGSCRILRASKSDPKLDLKTFVLEHFVLPRAEESTPPLGLSLVEHIEWLWPRLTREAKTSFPVTRCCTAEAVRRAGRPLPGAVLLGFVLHDAGAGEVGAARAVRRCSTTLRTRSNATGTSRTAAARISSSRSQPPFFASMVELAAELEGDSGVRALPAAAAPRARVLDGGRGRAASRQRTAAGGAPGGWHAAQSLLG